MAKPPVRPVVMQPDALQLECPVSDGMLPPNWLSDRAASSRLTRPVKAGMVPQTILRRPQVAQRDEPGGVPARRPSAGCRWPVHPVAMSTIRPRADAAVELVAAQAEQLQDAMPLSAGMPPGQTIAVGGQAAQATNWLSDAGSVPTRLRTLRLISITKPPGVADHAAPSCTPLPATPVQVARRSQLAPLVAA